MTFGFLKKLGWPFSRKSEAGGIPEGIKGDQRDNETAQVYEIPPDYPTVKDPDLPFEQLNCVQSFFRDHYNPNRNCVVQLGTGTGKTGLAYIASRYKLDEGKRTITMGPTRELVRDLEKSAIGVWGAGVVARNIGDDRNLAGKNYIITTPEGYISAVRQQKEWTEAHLLIVDEGHKVLEPGRSEALDAAITIHRQKGGLVLLMSGTLPLKEKLAAYLRADLFISNFVKTKLNDNPEVHSPDDLEAKETPKDVPEGMIHTASGYIYRGDSVRLKHLNDLLAKHKGESFLIFVPTKAVGYCLSESLLCPFHCGDLDEKERNMIVDKFNAGVVKTILATNTLSEGVNTAADVVIVCGTRRGKHYFDLTEVKQMFGRAGRGKPEATVYLLGDKIELFNAKKLAVVNSLPLPVENIALTMLSVQSSTREDLCSMVAKTFAATMTTQQKIGHAIDGYLRFLKSCNILLDRGGKYTLTTEGALLARYFISPRDYIAYIKIARKLKEVPTPKISLFEESKTDSKEPAPEPGKQDPARATVLMSPEEKGYILISTILQQVSAWDCPQKQLKELKFKLIPLGMDEEVNVARAALFGYYTVRPSAISPYLKFQINDVARWLGLFKDMQKFGVHAEVPGKSEIEAALKPLKLAITKYDALVRKKAVTERQKPVQLKLVKPALERNPRSFKAA